ncbi:related to NAD-dependent epimerase/dehydratase [Melanopsichium pennsylvanicum]|uniref:Related to NAD-dependent epimerase/dehydratase n=2 Tax=Melanopsichium pennsylvanicum TaxID=63383 RepID=A0AAJ4XR22_9BASI|nr:related to NAD-dependent epimerase/dehydratase [Melanopsichium pennsylvanicum 4]SNX86920.1 related to NAD-dependent epimerase/dehydratase [Melanopsichium pennsylvanicum]
MSSTNQIVPLALGESTRCVKPRVVVTGGSGKLGRATVAHLAASGYEVINFDRVRPKTASEDGKTGIGGAYRLVEIDLSDMGQVLEALMEVDMAYKGIDAIVHLAAMPSPGQSSSSKQFNTNVSSTYNVLEAARKLGITNLVLASSETLIGIPLDIQPSSLPITEESPLLPESAYSLSKLVGETLAEQFCRWSKQSHRNPTGGEMKIVSMRFSNVMLEEEYATFESWQDDVKKRYWNCWGYIDARDGAEAIKLALEKKDLKGHHAFIIANNNTVMKTSSKDLVQQVFPDVPYKPLNDDPNVTVLSNEKAKKVLGWQPKYDWKP